MSLSDRQTRTHLMRLFERHGFYPRGDLGQNFLIDINIVEFVAESAGIGPNDVILEIGAGTGGLTSFLAPNAAAVVSVEYDQNVFGLAKEMLDGLSNVTLIHADALKTKNQLNPEVMTIVAAKLAESPNRRLKLVANLPYNVATPVMSNLIATDLPWDCMLVTVQWELAQRMIAVPKSGGNYGALSAWMQSQCELKLLKKLGPQVFWPKPTVDSAILRVEPDPERCTLIADRHFFHEFVRNIFNQRRKSLRAVLRSCFRELDKPRIASLLSELNLAADCRAEELEPKTLVRLANRIGLELNEKTNQST